ncbi:hypothetical protein ACH5RR_033542 [Cinchona calisaya]|uniref:Uncharacterized protein n=1 Tax=Cinchona calisaya TaxID=153742 RepID=A0ABD2YL94_9GENT
MDRRQEHTSGFGGQSDNLPSEVSEDMEFALLPQVAAEKVSNQQWINARMLLKMCDLSASQSGNPIQRVVYYFAEALQERIDRKCGKFPSQELEGEIIRKPINVEQAEIHLQPATMACQQEIPFKLVAQFTAIQSIMDATASSRSIHLIDFGIENGSLWTVLMQHFTVRYDCPLELLKLMAVGSSKEILEVTGKWLSSFAESINLPFSFNIVVSDLKDLMEDFFKLEDDEVVAVYLACRLWTQLAWPNHLVSLIREIKWRQVLIHQFSWNVLMKHLSFSVQCLTV